MIVLSILVSLAALPALLVLWNLRLLKRPRASKTNGRRVSVLIPARNEAENIATAIESVLSTRYRNLELIVLDDQSDDATASIVNSYVSRDSRVRLLEGSGPTDGAWGKPAACARLAEAASGGVLIFMDADVRLNTDAVGRLVAALDESGCAMISGIPRQLMRTLAEHLIVPLIHFVLLGFLPFVAMRRTGHPAFAVACGQLIVVDRSTYLAVGGHDVVADKVHDGMALARRFRTLGYSTDIADFTKLADCRMYRSAGGVISGFAKNAHEGLGSTVGILPWSVLLLGGQSAWLLGVTSMPAAGVVTIAILVFGPRLLLARRFQQPLLGSLFHPIGVALLVLIQWYALARRASGYPVRWKQRVAAVNSARRRPRRSRARA